MVRPPCRRCWAGPAWAWSRPAVATCGTGAPSLTTEERTTAMMRPLFGLLLATTLCAARAQDTSAVFDPSRLKGRAHGTPNEVLVLGTPHLAGLPKSFDPATLRG